MPPDAHRPFTADDLDRLAEVAVAAWREGLDRDWSAPAGTLEWSCRRTADHAVDAVLAVALFLASRKDDGYPEWGWGELTMGPAARPTDLVEGLATVARVLSAVVRAAPPDARAVIWRRPRLEVRGPVDFAPRGGLELVLHAHDVATGLGVPFGPPADACAPAARPHPRVAALAQPRLVRAADDRRPVARPARRVGASRGRRADRVMRPSPRRWLRARSRRATAGDGSTVTRGEVERRSWSATASRISAAGESGASATPAPARTRASALSGCSRSSGSATMGTPWARAATTDPSPACVTSRSACGSTAAWRT